jgi:hypothetical protein
MTHFRTKMYVGQDQGVGQVLFLEPSLLISYYRMMNGLRIYGE